MTRLERIFFRFAVLAILVGVAGFVGTGMYWQHEASEWDKTVQVLFGYLREADARCSKENSNDRVALACSQPQQKMFDDAANSRDSAKDKADVAFHRAAWLPFLVVLLFYGSRWAITNRVNPVFPSRAQTEESVNA